MAKPIPLLKPSSTANRVACILRERILGLPEGDYIGSEADLATEIGVSLPTLRQAARMLEYEQLLKIKPGKGGGYFSRRPSIDTAIKSASQYLSSKDLISSASFMECADPIVEALIAGAVHCKDRELNSRLEVFIQSQREFLKSDVMPEGSFKFSSEMMTIFAEMSGNILLKLFSRILWDEYSISFPVNASYEATQELMRTNYELRLELAEAVLSKDEARARAAWCRRSKFLRSWHLHGYNLTARK
ncbi:MAG: FadR/GntR family transcriptional regulator [Pseudohongiellaceae bacterium]